MASPSRPESPDVFRLSSLEEGIRPTTKLLEPTDEESGAAPDALRSDHEETRPERTGSKMLPVWIMVNTVATIGIVSTANIK